ncbi:hypothetical protein OS493_006390 [Desmophyllum pertusum]|uniref:Uncharacterized protein n=1 Tax=Desmophyllum pertusum TaxID=174260 RepID=A0A9X0DAI9_9CNID|nr:hypothetical protein OS493_006390 [Desmophyllum pertusum]
MARLFVYLLLSFFILAFTNDVNAQDDSGEVDDDSGEGEDDSGEGEVDDFNSQANNPSCVSGEMKVGEQVKGIVRVSELSEGDVITGIVGAERDLAWCKVVAVFPAAGGKNMITHDGFTADHMVVDHTVHPTVKSERCAWVPCTRLLPTVMPL